MLNHAEIMGRITAEPELRYTQNGIAFLSFTLASDTGRKDPSGNKLTYFIDCVAWRQTAELIGKYVQKGALLAVEGELTPRVYEDKNKTKHKVTEVVVSRVHFCESKKDSGKDGDRAAADADGFMNIPDNVAEELPFG